MIKDENQIYWSQTLVQGSDTVSGTTTETVFASKPQVFRANSFVVGDVLEIEARGLLGTVALSLCTFIFRVKFGSVVLSSSAGIGGVGGLVNKAWELSAKLTVTSIGASGTAECGGKAMISTGTAVNVIDLLPAGGVIIDTTVDQQLQISVQPSINLGGNTITMRQFIVKKFRV